MRRGGPCAAFSPSPPAKNLTRWTLASRARSRLPSSCLARAHGHSRLLVVGHYDLGPASPRIAYTLPSPSLIHVFVNAPRAAASHLRQASTSRCPRAQCTGRQPPIVTSSHPQNWSCVAAAHEHHAVERTRRDACARLRDTRALPGSPVACNSNPIAP